MTDQDRRLGPEDFEDYVQQLIDAHGHAKTLAEFLRMSIIDLETGFGSEVREAARRLFGDDAS